MRNFNRPGVWLGTVAVVLAMGGTATAASMVTSANIKDGTIAAKDIKRGAIGMAQISTSAKDALEGSVGNTGATGAQGPAGPMGPAGPSAVGQIILVRGARATFAPGSYVATSTATCPAGMRAISGGGAVISSGGVNVTEASASRQSWYVIGSASSAGEAGSYVEASAYCAPQNGAVAASAGSNDAREIAATTGRVSKLTEARILCTSARIGGKKKCIARGQFCAYGNRSDYRKYGFTCKKDTGGRYRLV